MDKAPHWFLHVDLDAFFASVEQLDNPELRGKPVIVGGKPEDRRSVVSTASYEARVFGVHSAMPTYQAYKLCPQGIFVHGRMHRYAELSHQIMNIFRDYSPDVDQMSIDEAFIDLTGTEKLFGPPEETAKQIKARVKAETGLTVSVGLATTKYLAKISSGLSKPDGFYHIKYGNEENFMLNLPLNKVWGLGPKSLDLIRSKGFNSTRDIYEKDFETLEFLFGKNMASFLYNVVRGIEKDSFKKETKSHSISAESTFPYDLTDIYTIETELLELAQGVFFRLLKEESFSRTAMVKIRYDDFSTCTVQETVERNIITLDSFYEIIKRLFEKKYERNRGIRLLGVGFENIVKEEKPYQQDLFSDNKDEKKQAVEKAILSLSKKHPEIKVSKARTLKTLLAAFLLALYPAKANAKDTAETSSNEPPVYLFNYDIDDANNVDFSVSGLWKIEFTTGIDFSFGNGTSFAISPSLPVFKQETDISTLFTINNHWYFEAAFADEFTKNTFAFGYKGDGLVRSFRLANRGITMSSGYSAEHFGYALRGGNNQSPGLSLHMISPSEKIEAEFLVRYDMTETKSETFYGMNKVTDLKIRAEDFAYGREFHLPSGVSQKLYEIKNIYLESSAGTYSDGRGKIYRKLRKDEYSVARINKGSLSEPRLFISQESGGSKNSDGKIPSIIITFNTGSSAQEIINSAGNWNDGSSFLGMIQTVLGNGGQFNLADYSYQMQTTIDGDNALIIQNYQGFSPFLCPTIYDSGPKTEADYQVIADKSEIPVSKYTASEAEEAYTNLYVNFFDTQQSYVRVTNKDQPQSVYPFAEDCPEIYLGLQQKTDLAIRARTYTHVNEIIISKNAAAGTVQVYKNGNLLTSAVFNETTGVIELNTIVSDTDQILVTWQEETSDFSSGAVAAAAGVKFNLLPELTGDISLTTRIPVNIKTKLAENGSLKNSFTVLSTGINYEKNGLVLTDKAAVSLLNDNTSNGLLIYSWKEVMKNYQEEVNSNPNKIILKPEKVKSISFKEQDISPYKKISAEIEVLKNTASVINGYLSLTFDEDTGTLEAGNETAVLVINRINTIYTEEGVHKITISTDGKAVFVDGNQLPEDEYNLRINNKIIPSRLKVEASNDEIKTLIESISFEEAMYYGAFRNYTAVEYKKSGSIVKTGNYDLLKDIHISASSDQGTGNFTKPEPFISAKADGGLTFSGIIFNADAAIQNVLSDFKLSEAGHSIKTSDDYLVLKILSAEDTYRYKMASRELRKTDVFGLDFSPLKFPLKTNLKTIASSTPYLEKQNTEITAGYIQKISDIEIGINGKLTVDQKIQEGLTHNYSQELPSYGQSWLNISGLEFSIGSGNASARNTLWSFALDSIIPFKNKSLTIKPKITYELSNSYRHESDSSTTDNGNLFSDKEYIQLLIPFTAEKTNFSFEISRTGGQKQNIAAGGNYIEDTQKLFVLQNQRSWFYTSIPFYELFDTNLKNKVNAGYAAKYEGNFRRSLYNSIKDVYIPSALTLALTREITQEEPQSDIYQIKLVVTNNSINNFGKNSKDKIFDWFLQEELTTNLTTILKIPAEDPGNMKINIQAFAQLLLFIKEKTILSEQFDFSIENSADWSIRDTIAYSRPSESSLITSLVNFVVPEAQKTDYKISRKDSFSIQIGRIDAVFKQKYTYNHTVGIDFLEYYNVNASIGGTLLLNQNTADKFSLTLTLGAKAEF